MRNVAEAALGTAIEHLPADAEIFSVLCEQDGWRGGFFITVRYGICKGVGEDHEFMVLTVSMPGTGHEIVKHVEDC